MGGRGYPLPTPTDAVDLGLECATCPLPFTAIEFATARFHARRVGVALDLCVANVAENLQVIDRVGSVFALGHNVIDLQGTMIGATANGTAMIVFGHYDFAGRFVSDLGHRSVPSVCFNNYNIGVRPTNVNPLLHIIPDFFDIGWLAYIPRMIATPLIAKGLAIFSMVEDTPPLVSLTNIVFDQFIFGDLFDTVKRFPRFCFQHLINSICYHT